MILRLTRKLLLLLIVLSASGCGGPSAEERYSSNDPCLRASAACGYGACDQPESAERLIRLLSDDDEAVRFYAAAALQRRCGERFGYEPQDDPRQRAAAVRQAISWYDAKFPQCAGRLDDLKARLDELHGEPQEADSQAGQ